MKSLGRIFTVLFALAGFARTAEAAEPIRVTAEAMQRQSLKPVALTYFVYVHDGLGTGIKQGMLTTMEVMSDVVDGTDAWVIEQRWENESGVIHRAMTVHSKQDLSTHSQLSEWVRPGGSYKSIVFPQEGRGEIEGDMPRQLRQEMEAGFATMKELWWLNWHSDLLLLPLLPYDTASALRVRVFDVGMSSPIDVDYVVVGNRTLNAANGMSYDCWLVETESGSPGSGNYQRFWIDKSLRIVVKEEDVFNGTYRTKILLSVPAKLDFPAPPAARGLPIGVL